MTWTAWSVAFLLIMGGCLAGPPPAAVLHGFEATILIGDLRATASLDAVEAVAWPDGDVRPAYRFRVDYHESSRQDNVYYLDAEWRVVRNDMQCEAAEDACTQYRDIFWTSAGSVAPFGLALDQVVPEGGPLLHSWRGVDWLLQATLTEPGTYTVTIAQEPRGLPYPSGSTFTFQEGQLLPTSASLTILDYRSGDPLPSVRDRVLPMLQPVAAVGQHALAPGADVDVLGSGLSPLAFFQAAAAGPAKEWVDRQDCLVVLEVDADVDRTPLGGRIWHGSVEFLAPTSKVSDVLVIRVEESLLGFQATTEGRSTREHRHTCDDLKGSPAPSMRLDEAFALVEKVWTPGPAHSLRIAQKSWWNRAGNETGIFGYDIDYGSYVELVGSDDWFEFGRLYYHVVNPHLHVLEASLVHPGFDR